MIQTKFYKNERKEGRYKSELKEADGADSHEGRRLELEHTQVLDQKGREKHSSSLGESGHNKGQHDEGWKKHGTLGEH